MKCKHKHVEARIWSRHWHHWIVVAGPDYRGTIDAIICRDCGEWLGLGPSNDDPAAVKTEMNLAAVLSAYIAEHGFSDSVHGFAVEAFAELEPQ